MQPRRRWICPGCGAEHHYLPAKCQRCGALATPPREQRPPEAAAESQFQRSSDADQQKDARE